MNEHSDSQGLAPVQTTKTPEPAPNQQQQRLANANDQANLPDSPGVFTTFDWEDFETRYTEALDKADGQEQELMREFDELVKYFNTWAASSSAHDTERSVKRLQTRQRFVNLSEQTMEKRQQHMQEVLQAFQSALALLRQT